ncbi:MAG: DUF3073 domain-containing protein [Propionibacteriaceae bacterium]|jgi:hypothetical protein|nr:DUF3073 domain-containing protein [Propionibacteriaceae bacterium]
MGRGRQKAKQTKVARDLKYRPVDADFVSLERELRGHDDDGHDGSRHVDPEYSEIPEEWADVAAKYLAPADDTDD